MNPLLALAWFSAPSFDATPGPDELAASVAALDFLGEVDARSAITLSWSANGYAASGSRGAARKARCIAPDDPRYDALVEDLDPDQARAVAGTIHYDASEGQDGVGRATFHVSAGPASPVAPTTALCLVSDVMHPVAVIAVRFESTGENRAHYTAIVFPVGPIT